MHIATLFSCTFKHAALTHACPGRGTQLVPSAEVLAAAQEVVQAWALLGPHPNLVVPRAAFVTAELEGGPALVFAHAYHPGAITLEQAHLLPGASAQPASCMAARAPYCPAQRAAWLGYGFGGLLLSSPLGTLLLHGDGMARVRGRTGL